MSRRPLLRLTFVVVALLVSACGEATDQGPPSTSTTTAPSTTTTPTTVTTTSVAEPDPDPVEVESLARLPDEDSLQDGDWAAIVFHQALDCVSETADLVSDLPRPCETPVLFSDDGSGTITGVYVPVWLIRWPVLAHAVADGSTTIEELRTLPTLQETTSDVYVESGEGTVEISGRLPGGGSYTVEVAGATSFEILADTAGEPLTLSELTGRWTSDAYLLEIDEGGSYELFESGAGESVAETGVFGFVAVQDGLFVFVTSTEPGPCPGASGVYYGEMTGPTMNLHPVDETCLFRERAFHSSWSPSSQ